MTDRVRPHSSSGFSWILLALFANAFTLLLRLSVNTTLPNFSQQTCDSDLWHGNCFPIFYLLNDQFADGIKNVFSTPLIHFLSISPETIASYSPLFQSYATSIDYITDNAANPYAVHMLPPVQYLALLLSSFLLYHTNPLCLFAFQYSIYISLLILFSRFLSRFFNLSLLCSLLVFLTVSSSYPFLYGLDRNNPGAFLSAFLSIAFFLWSSTSSAWILTPFLALSISFRPNNLVYVLHYLTFPRRKLTYLLALTLFLIVIFNFSALVFSHAIDPLYTLRSFLDGLSWYNNLITSSDISYLWQSSIYAPITGIIKQHSLDLPPSILALPFLVIVSLLMFIHLSTTKTSRFETSVIYLIAFNVLFTPVFANYHLLILPLAFILLSLSASRSYFVAAPKTRFLLSYAFLLLFLILISAQIDYFVLDSFPYLLFSAVFLILLSLFIWSTPHSISSFHLQLVLFYSAALPLGSSISQGCLSSFLLISIFFIPLFRFNPIRTYT